MLHDNMASETSFSCKMLSVTIWSKRIATIFIH